MQSCDFRLHMAEIVELRVTLANTRKQSTLLPHNAIFLVHHGNDILSVFDAWVFSPRYDDHATPV